MSDLETIRRTLRFLKEPGELIELRCDHLVSERKVRLHGYYNDHEKLARDAEEFEGNCYLTINRLDPTIPATNELRRCKKGACTKAENIVRRTLFYLDGDAVKPAGTPSTDAQHQAAIDRVKFIAEQLPFPRPLIGSSGNGACAWWKIDLAPDSPLPKLVLRAIKKKWETPAVTIDTTVASVSRIGRLLGTHNYKGGHIGRQATIIDAPQRVVTEEILPPPGVTVTPELLAALKPVTRTEDLPLELLTEQVMEAFAPLPKEQTEKARVQQLVTSWSLGKTEQEQVANIAAILSAKGIQFGFSESPDSRGTLCKWFHFDCVFRPGQNDAKNWIKVHPTEGVTAGCYHQKCQGKGLLHLLAVIAPELAAQAAEGYDDSHRLARGFLQSRLPLVIWQGSPHGYQDGAYREESEASVKAELNLHVKREFNALGFEETPNVTTKVVHNAYQAASALVFDRAESAPHWRRRNGHHDASEYLLFNNGLLHVPTYLDGKANYWVDPTSDYFSLAKLPYDFDPHHTVAPTNFTAYCQYQWADANVHLLLEEIMGDILMGDLRQRSFYAFLGKGFAGKSAVVEGAFEGLVGEHNRCAVDLAGFAKDFGLEGAIGKKLILVSEAGVDFRYSSGIVEKIKRITGGDPISVNRKNKSILSVRLNAKILAVSNHLLRMIDDSGALFDRLVPLLFTRRIEEDKADKTFPAKLRGELSGIVLLALKGWKRLRDNGRFTMPDSSKQVLSDLRETGSPILTFIKECCQLDKKAFTATERLWERWKDYFCPEHDLKAGEKDAFVAAIKSAFPELRRDRQSVAGKQVRGFVGIEIKVAGK
jgi:P4 family phage/plasmid primase-like protien